MSVINALNSIFINTPPVLERWWVVDGDVAPKPATASYFSFGCHPLRLGNAANYGFLFPTRVLVVCVSIMPLISHDCLVCRSSGDGLFFVRVYWPLWIRRVSPPSRNAWVVVCSCAKYPSSVGKLCGVAVSCSSKTR